MKRYNVKFLLASILMLLYSLMSVSFAVILKYIIDSISVGDQSSFFRFLFMAISVTLGEFLFAILSRFYTLRYVKDKLSYSKENFYQYLLNENYKNELNKNESDIAMFSSNVDILYASYYVNKVLLVKYVATFVLSIYAVIYLNWVVCLVAFFTSLVPLVIPQLFKKKVQSSIDDYSSKSTKYLDFISDSVRGIDEIRSYNNQQAFSERHIIENSILEKSRSKSKMIVYFVNMLSSSFGSLTFLITIGVSGYLVIKGNATIGSMIAIVQLLNSMVTPLAQISSAINEINSSKNIVDKYNVDISIDDSTYGDINSFNNDITISNLTYSYENNVPVISNFSYKFEKGKKYAIIGESGSGKSTLAKLISGNIKGYSGKIMIDGIDLENISLRSYRELCRYINQQSYIFKDTIENNILFFSKEKKNINNVIKMFNLEKLIESVGLNKIITDTEGISGGQKQRIVLSRALIRNSPLLILDEPTASLDYINTNAIINELMNIEDLTLIIITHEHDDNLLNLFDEVINIENVNQAV